MRDETTYWQIVNLWTLADFIIVRARGGEGGGGEGGSGEVKGYLRGFHTVRARARFGRMYFCH